MAITRKAYDDFRTGISNKKARFFSAITDSMDKVANFRDRFRKNNNLDGTILFDTYKLDTSDYFLTTMFFLISITILTTVLYGLTSVGVLLDLFLPRLTTLTILGFISIWVAVKIIKTFFTKLEDMPKIHWWWLPFANRVDLRKLFGPKSTFDKYGPRYYLIDKFLLQTEPGLALWYIDYNLDKAYFLKTSDLVYLKLKYYNQNIEKELLEQSIIDEL